MDRPFLDSDDCLITLRIGVRDRFPDLDFRILDRAGSWAHYIMSVKMADALEKLLAAVFMNGTRDDFNSPGG